MIFLNPLGFLGLLSLPIILALHLFRERNRQLIVSNLEMWSFLEMEVRGTRPRRLPITPILLLHLLVAIMFSLAWAQPRLLVEMPVQEARQQVLLLDVSFSMSARDVVPSRFDQAVVFAGNLLNSLGPNDTAYLITFGAVPRLESDLGQSDLPAMLETLARLEPVQRGSDLQAGLALGLSMVDGRLPVEFHIFTDGAYPAPNLSGFPYPIQWMFFSRESDNQAVTSVVPYTEEDGYTQVFTSFINYSRNDRSRQVVLYFDGEPVDSTKIFINAGSPLIQTWRVAGRPNLVTVALASPDNLSQDDMSSTGMQQSTQSTVVIVADDPGPFEKAVQAVQNTTLRIIAPADYNPLTQADLTIFRGYLPPERPLGLVLLVDPPQGSVEKSNWAPVVTGNQHIPALDAFTVVLEDPLLDGLELTSVLWSSIYTLESIPDDYEILIKISGQPLLLRNQMANGAVLMLLHDSSRGNFTQHPAFPILINNLIMSTNAAPVSGNLLSGEPLWLPSNTTFRSLTISMPDGQDIRLSDNWPAFWTDTQTPGIYTIVAEDLDGQLQTYYIGVNAADPQESNIARHDWGSLPEHTQATKAEATDQTYDLMPWVLGLALLLIFFEAILAWR